MFSQLKSFEQDGVERSYLLSRPKNVSKDTRIIIGLHGFTDSARKFAYYTGLHNTVNKDDIVIYPNAIEPQIGQLPGWNANFCCGSGRDQGVDDAKFIAELSKSIRDDYNVPNAKVFVVGFSNGGFIAQKLAIKYDDLISGVTVGSGAIGTQKERLLPIKPTPILLMHGDDDKTIPISGGATLAEPDFTWLAFDEMKQSWEKVNQEYTETKTVVYPKMGHSWKGWRIINFWHKTPEASIEAMQFFTSHKD